MGFFSGLAEERHEINLSALSPPKLAEAAAADTPPKSEGTEVDERKQIEETKRQAHEAAEAKRKAEFDAKQAARKAARQEQLDRIKAMNDAELLAASVNRVAADTEKLTRRNMREAVADHIQAKCRENAAFAMLVMDPDKTMIRCFMYINRKAREYAEQEMKVLGIERKGTYGLDVPDGLCYQWAEEYFRDHDAPEDKEDEEKFTPKPYIPSHNSKLKTANKPKAAAKTAQTKPTQKAAPNPQQCSLFGEVG